MLCREEQALLSWGKSFQSAWKLAAIGFTRHEVWADFWSHLTYFCKNHGEFGKYNVLAMCRVNNMANKISLDPKSVVGKSVTAALTYERGEWIYTFSTGNATIPSGKKKKKKLDSKFILNSSWKKNVLRVLMTSECEFAISISISCMGNFVAPIFFLCLDTPCKIFQVYKLIRPTPGGGGGGHWTFFQVGVLGPDFWSVGLANGYLPLKRGGLWTENCQIWGLVSWKFPNLGACELKIVKFGGLRAKICPKIEAVEAKISKFSQKGVLWTDSFAWNGTLASGRRGVKRGSSGPHIPIPPF